MQRQLGRGAQGRRGAVQVAQAGVLQGAHVLTAGVVLDMRG